jgi:uncharacterized protein YgbK (DUF1537 family)
MPNLVRVLQAQCKRKCGADRPQALVAQGEACHPCAHRPPCEHEGVGLAVVDAVSNADLLRLGPALKGMPLVTAGSGVAIGAAGQLWRMAPQQLSAGRLARLHRACRRWCRAAARWRPTSQVQAIVASRPKPALAHGPAAH